MKHYIFVCIVLLIYSGLTIGSASSNDLKERVAIFIVGTGRCGSSCLTGTLKIMGLELGNNLRPATPNNLTGPHEDLPTIEFHQKEFCGQYDFHHPALIDWDNHPEKNKYIELTKKHLQKNFGEYEIFGLKNPEIGVRLPIYLEAARELGYKSKVIIAIRRPHEAALSLKKITTLSMEQCYSNISVYLTACLWAIKDCEVLTVFYEDLLYHTEETVDRLYKFVPNLKPFSSVKDKLANFLDVNLKHN